MNAAIANTTVGFIGMADNNGNPVLRNVPTPAPQHDYVDLGVVVNNKKILFATMNVGANSITDYGNYYAWGETETKGNYTWNNYAFGTSSAITKYNSTDSKTVLDLIDDVVNAEWGGGWRMPTGDELQALLNQTTNAWVTDYNGSGINGRVFTGTNGNTMFIPAAGYWDGSFLYEAGSLANVWSSSLDSSYVECARRLGFYSSAARMGGDSRSFGFSVRGIMAVDA